VDFIPLLHWEEGLGEEVAAVFDGEAASSPCPYLTTGEPCVPLADTRVGSFDTDALRQAQDVLLRMKLFGYSETLTIASC
jgi:hypothetical protein